MAIGAGLVFADGSYFSIYVAAPLSIAGSILLIFGMMITSENIGSGELDHEWSPEISKMPDAGRPMYRIDTTLKAPVTTTILCGRCSHLEEISGGKPPSYRCVACGIELWEYEEE